MQLKFEKVLEIPREWNMLDQVTAETKMLHTTGRLTQPWRTGLPIDFTINKPQPLFGFIPRFWVTHPTHYQPHPDKMVVDAFFAVLKSAIAAGAVTTKDIDDGIASKDLRPDIKLLLT